MAVHVIRGAVRVDSGGGSSGAQAAGGLRDGRDQEFSQAGVSLVWGSPGIRSGLERMFAIGMGGCQRPAFKSLARLLSLRLQHDRRWCLVGSR